MFEGDVLLFNTKDGGNISIVNGQPEMTGDFRTMIFLCLFGGNLQDDGLAGNTKTWWGNIEEENISRKYISRFQNLIHQAIPLTSGNLRRIELAALADLEVFKTEKIAEEVTAVAAIVGINKLKLEVNVNSPSGENSQTEFLINWQSFPRAA